MNQNLTFMPGNFVHYISRKTFALGTTGITLQEGMSVWYDGSTAIVGPSEEEGDRYSVPNLRGAVKTGWLVSAEQYMDGDTAAPPPPSAGMQMRQAVNLSANPMAPAPTRHFVTTVQADEQIVGNATQRASQVKERNTHSRYASQGPGVTVVDGNGQIGTVVRPLQVPAKQTTEVTPQSLGSAIRNAESIKIQPGQGVSEEDMLAEMSEQERESYLAKKESIRARYVESERKPKVVSKVANSKKVMQSGGMKVTTTVVGDNQDVVDLAGLDDQSPARVETIDVGGIKLTNTNGPKRANQVISGKASAPNVMPASQAQQPKIVKDGTEDPRKMLAKKFCPDFPEDYNFADHWKRRIAMIRLNYENRSDIIQAIFMAESDDFKRVLLEEFPEVFGREMAVGV